MESVTFALLFLIWAGLACLFLIYILANVKALSHQKWNEWNNKWENKVTCVTYLKK